MKQAAIAYPPIQSGVFNRAIVTLTDGLENSAKKIRYWQVRREATRELSALPDTILRDIGTNRCDIPARAQALAEASIRR